jgi:2-iminobutanoate/2-iminopropanoate deaminase
MPPKKIIATALAPQAIGPYSQAVDLGDLVFVSAQIPLDAATQQTVTGPIEVQTDRVLKNLQGVLASAGLSLENVVRTTVYLTDLANFPKMNEVYARFFSKDFPARTTVQVAGLPRGVGISIDAIARR